MPQTIPGILPGRGCCLRVDVSGVVVGDTPGRTRTVTGTGTGTVTGTGTGTGTVVGTGGGNVFSIVCSGTTHKLPPLQ